MDCKTTNSNNSCCCKSSCCKWLFTIVLTVLLTLGSVYVGKCCATQAMHEQAAVTASAD